MNISSIESILFVLKKPTWNKKGVYRKDEFWGARGVVRSFLDDLYRLSLAPIKEDMVYEEGFSSIHCEVTYL